MKLLLLLDCSHSMVYDICSIFLKNVKFPQWRNVSMVIMHMLLK